MGSNTFEHDVWGSWTKLLRFATKYWGRSLSKEDIEDLIQDTFIAALVGQHSFRGECQLSTWLVGIFHNRAMTFAKRRARIVSFDEAFPSDSEEYWEDSFSVEATQEDDLIATQDVQRVRCAVAQLPPRQREVVVQCYLGENTVDEVATSIGSPAATVKTNMFYARKTLQKYLVAR